VSISTRTTNRLTFFKEAEGLPTAGNGGDDGPFSGKPAERANPGGCGRYTKSYVCSRYSQKLRALTLKGTLDELAFGRVSSHGICYADGQDFLLPGRVMLIRVRVRFVADPETAANSPTSGASSGEHMDMHPEKRT